MHAAPLTLAPGGEADQLLPYVTDLEFEVDRLRKQGRYLEEQAWATLKQVRTLCRDFPAAPETQAGIARIKQVLDGFGRLLVDLHQDPGYHPAHDQVVLIAVRPLFEQVFRRQQRLTEAPHAVLHLELEIDYVDWFPARLRHIVDSLVGNALRHGSADKGEARVTIALRRSARGYELRVADNGRGVTPEARADLLNSLHRAAAARSLGSGVGLAVVQSLIEQSGGSLTLQSDEGRGTCFLAILPRYDVDDYLEKNLEAPIPEPGEPARSSS